MAKNSRLLHDNYMTTNGTRREAYIWGASVVEVSTKSFIELWEQRNEEVHGKTEAQKQNDDSKS